MSNKDIRILVTIPNQHWIHKHVVHKMLLILLDGRYSVNIQMPSHKPFVNNLHHIVNEFFYEKYDFWLSMDADNPPLNNPLDLIELEKDIIGLPTPIWHYTKKRKERPVYWNAYDYDDAEDAYREHQNRDGLQEVDAIGTGCFIIKRSVFEVIDMRKGPFLRVWNKDGTMKKGNDFPFCEKAKSHGFKIYCHYGYPCDHFSELSLQEVVNAFKNMYEDD